MAQELRFERDISRRLKLRELYIVSAVVDHGSMAKAAEQLAMSQPAVSDAVAKCEATLGVRLLDRNRRGVTPTVYAQTLLKRGVVIFDELRQAIRDIEFLKNPVAGQVRIACSEALAAGFMPALVHEFVQRYPLVEFYLIEENTATMQFRELRNRNVDLMLGFVSDHAESDDDFDIEVLFEDQLFVVSGAGSKWARRRKIALEELACEFLDTRTFGECCPFDRRRCIPKARPCFADGEGDLQFSSCASAPLSYRPLHFGICRLRRTAQ